MNLGKSSFLRHIFVLNMSVKRAPDHSPVEVSFKYVDQSRRKSSWKNNSLFYDKEYVQFINQCINGTLLWNFQDNGINQYSVNDQLLWNIKTGYKGSNYIICTL